MKIDDDAEIRKPGSKRGNLSTHFLAAPPFTLPLCHFFTRPIHPRE